MRADALTNTSSRRFRRHTSSGTLGPDRLSLAAREMAEPHSGQKRALDESWLPHWLQYTLDSCPGQVATDTIGVGRVMPPSEPRYGKLEKSKIPPSEPTMRYPLP
jgi:hypothetical protein